MEERGVERRVVVVGEGGSLAGVEEGREIDDEAMAWTQDSGMEIRVMAWKAQKARKQGC